MPNKEVALRNPNFHSGTGTSTFLSFFRLEETLRDAGELANNEELSGVVMTDYGIQYYIQKKE